MAAQRTYTLNDFTSRALLYFPDAYKTVSDAKYEFRTRDLADVTTPAVVDVLHVAYWNHRRHQIPVVASISPDGSSIGLFHYSRKREGLVNAGLPFPERSCIIQGWLAPFEDIPPSEWPRDEKERKQVRLEAREQFMLLAKFAFLKTGRIKNITSEAEIDLHVLFEQLCYKLLNVKDDVEPRSAKRRAAAIAADAAVAAANAAAVSPEDDDDDLGSLSYSRRASVVDNKDVETFGETNIFASGFAGSRSSTAGIPVRNARHTGTLTPVSDDEYVEPDTEPAVEHGTYPPFPP